MGSKQPQAMSKSRASAADKAMMNERYINADNNADASVNLSRGGSAAGPNSKTTPTNSSTQGNTKAQKLTKKVGRKW